MQSTRATEAARRLDGVERLEGRAAGGHGVLDERHGLAFAEGALDALAEAVLLGLLAHEEAAQVAPLVAGAGGGEQDRGDDGHGGHDHAAHRVDARAVRQLACRSRPASSMPRGRIMVVRRSR
jgi:hypothetical protein